MDQKPKCQEAEKRFAPMLSREIRSGDERKLRRHLAVCEDCTRRLADLSAAWNLLGRWEDEMPPASLDGRVRGQVADAMRVDASAEPSGGIRMGREVFLPVSLGVLFALISVAGALWNLEKVAHPVFSVIVTVALWSGLYVAAFLAVFRRLRIGGVDVGRLAAVALAGNAGALLFFTLCPISSEKDVCHTIPFLEPLFAVGGGTLAYFILGAMSAILPMYLLTAIVGKRIETAPGRAALLMGAIVAVLITPALVLQKAPLTIEGALLVLASTVLGLFAGSFLGTVAGLWTTSRVGAANAV
ncbi:MAG: hypothetical protein Q8R92_13515 [Deltaproteobacteria bacterium]|nr:hypothetical protein [Deltaproteobacteria bacterium]